jgi:uncharacterized protein with ParB-like and HNH nuclease domain
MAKVNLLDTRTANFGDLMGNGKIYTVPKFQRDYSWDQDNWNDLWEDILALHHGEQPSHYMGAVVLQNAPESDREFQVIDGQQRLVTISTIVIGVIEQIRQLVLAGVDSENNQERQEILKRTYLGDKNPSSLRYSSKLILNENNNSFYQSNLINLRPPINSRLLSKSDRSLWQAYEYFSDRIQQDLVNLAADGESLASFVTEVIAKKLLFIQINVEDELNAYTLFETLNARGISLGPTDLLKNYLFSLFRGPDDLAQAQRQWQNIMAMVRMEKFAEFLKHYFSLQYNFIRTNKLFKIAKNTVSNAQQSFDLLDNLEKYSYLFTALDNPEDDFWQDFPEANIYVRELSLFRVRQIYPVLFAAHDKFPASEFTRILRMLSIISFRYTVVGDRSPSGLERIYTEAAQAIIQDRAKNLQQVFAALKSAYVSDEEFKSDFTRLSLPTKNSKNKKLVQYILGELETAVTNKKVAAGSFTIEHILPERFAENWSAEFSEEQGERSLYRLGNLTLLERELNRDLGQKDFAIKQAAYQQSIYALTRAINGVEWNPVAIAERQAQLAEASVKIWQLDY